MYFKNNILNGMIPVMSQVMQTDLVGACLLNTTSHFAVYFEVQRLTTMRAFCFDHNRKGFAVFVKSIS